MGNIFFKIEGILYTVCYKNEQVNICKLESDNYIELNDKEQEIIKKILVGKYSYIYNSDLLESLVSQNDKIENKNYLYNFLSWQEKIIPLECRDNFYRNIKTLETELNINFIDQFDVSSGYSTSGGYNTVNNKLTISKHSLSELRQIANTTNEPDEFYWKSYSQTLLHELSHMASSNYNSETSISLCGFDTYPSQKIEDQNRGLTEGFTDIISMAGVPGTIEIASGYYIEASLINQLISIIGNEVLIKSYFSNLGIEPIKLKLQELIPEQEKSFELFRHIELNYQIRHINEEQNVLGTIQSTLLDYLKIKIQNMYELGEYKNIENLFSFYEQFLITSEKMKIMNKNPDNYIGLYDSLDKFIELRDSYVTKLNMNDDEHKIK